MKRSLVKYGSSIVVGIIAAVVIAAYISPRALADPSDGSTFTVNTYRDVGDSNPGDGVCWTGTNFGAPECTLRAAIEEANANNNPAARDKIWFSLPNDNTMDGALIPIASTLEITQPVEINGYSRVGASANTAPVPQPFNGTLKVVVSGVDMTGSDPMFSVLGGGSDSIIRGLVINRNPGSAIKVGDSADNVQIYGNYLGTDLTGMLTDPSDTPDGNMVSIEDGATATHVGGALPEQRNIIVAPKARPIYVGGAQAPTGGFIQGNYIGVAADGVSALGFLKPIVLDEGVNNYLIGGDSLSAQNTIENTPDSAITLNKGSFNNQIVGNRIVGDNRNFEQIGGITTYGALDSIIRGNTLSDDTAGIRLDASGSDYSDGISVVGNNIGVTEDGTTSLPNRNSGIIVQKANNSIIGGTDPADANIIAHNTGYTDYVAGIMINNNSTGIAIIGNSIFDNKGLGIDFYGNGVNTNDYNDYDGGVNGLLNFPEGRRVQESGGNTIIDYRFNGPAGQYRIEFFSNTDPDASGYGEGQTLIGTQNITKTGDGYQSFTKTITGTGYTNLALTATEIDADSPSGFGSTSEFGRLSGVDETDLSITKTLTNPRDIAPGAELDYAITFKNNGPVSVDISQFDGSGMNPLATSLFIDILPPDLTFNSVVGNNDVDCTPYGPGSAALPPFFSNHTEYELVLCAYTGSSNILTAGQSYTVHIKATVANDSDLNFQNFVMSGLTPSDPDAAAIYSAYGTPDALDTLLADNINNLSTTGNVSDLEITKEIVDDTKPATDGTIQYKIKVSNKSGAPIDLARFDDGLGPFVNYLFTDIMPPEITYTGITGNVSCAGPAPASMTGPAFGNHSSYNLLVCGWSGGSYLLERGDSVEFILSATVAQPVPQTFVNYAFLGVFGSGGYNDALNDPDTVSLLKVDNLGNIDILSAMLGLKSQNSQFNNLAQVRYGTESEGGGGDSGGGSSGNSSSGGGLSGTGQSILIVGGIIVLLLAGGTVLIIKSRKKKEKNNTHEIT